MTEGTGDVYELEEIPWNLNEAELVLIQRALKKTQGNISKAAELLGVHRMKIYRRLAKNENIEHCSS
ncbi:MAG: hypothetical protein HOE48_23795 [Candidatus Latescibacteria bacterium]|jgi:DNA-binding NtrC family response regulator|nr:hypothetical protein [Candidatus Latescibacterota bacterium]